jgi:hypothetical protein
MCPCIIDFIGGNGLQGCARDNLRGQKSPGPLKMSLEMVHKVIVPPKKNYIPQFLKQRDINSYKRESAADSFFLHKNQLNYTILCSLSISGASSVPIPGSKSSGLESRFKRNRRLKKGGLLLCGGNGGGGFRYRTSSFSQKNHSGSGEWIIAWALS